MRFALISMALMVGVGTAHAAEPAPYEEPIIEIHGFVSPGYVLTTSGTNFLARSDDGGSVEFVEVGLNFTKQLTPDLRLGLQLFARDLGPVGDYTPKIDWFYLDYRFRDWLGFRAGRVKIPFGLYNETVDIDAARVPVLFPQSVYPVNDREFLLAQTGAELYGYVPLGDVGALSYAVYAGTIFLANESAFSQGGALAITIPYVFGGRVVWETPLQGLRFAASVLAGQIEVENPVIFGEIDAILWVASMELAIDDFTLAAEFGRWNLALTTTNQELAPDTESTTDRGYVMLSYRVNHWFQPGIYYAVLSAADRSDRRDGRYHDVALTLRFDVNEHWLWKVEGHYVNGTAMLLSSLNDDTPLAELPAAWGALLVKTTAYF